MKKISAIMITGIFFFLTLWKVSAQELQAVKASTIQPYNLAITFNKTTNLVFPYAIKSVDKGSKEVLIQKAVGVENVLQLKAAQQGFAQTNLTVITADGSLYPYVLNYADEPANLNMVFSTPQVNPHPLAVFAKDATTDEIAKKAKEVSGRDRMIKGVRDKDCDVVLDLKGIYIHNEILYFELSLQNHSAIDYDVQSLRFFIHDKKRSKRTASQEIEMQPVYISGDLDRIMHASEQSLCVALPKFTIPDKKYLTIQLMEKNGGRHLSVKIKNKLFVHASALL